MNAAMDLYVFIVYLFGCVLFCCFYRPFLFLRTLEKFVSCPGFL